MLFRSLGAIDTIGSFEQIPCKSPHRTSYSLLQTDNGIEAFEGVEGIVHQRIHDTGPVVRSRNRDGEVRDGNEACDQDEERKTCDRRQQAVYGIHGLVVESFDSLQSSGERRKKRGVFMQLESRFNRGIRQYQG